MCSSVALATPAVLCGHCHHPVPELSIFPTWSSAHPFRLPPVTGTAPRHPAVLLRQPYSRVSKLDPQKSAPAQAEFLRCAHPCWKRQIDYMAQGRGLPSPAPGCPRHFMKVFWMNKYLEPKRIRDGRDGATVWATPICHNGSSQFSF